MYDSAGVIHDYLKHYIQKSLLLFNFNCNRDLQGINYMGYVDKVLQRLSNSSSVYSSVGNGTVLRYNR